MTVPRIPFFRTRFTGAAVVVPALCAILGVLIFAPFATVLYASLIDSMPFAAETKSAWTLGNYGQLWSPALLDAAWNTLLVTAGGATIAMGLGCSMAWLAARTDIPCKPLVHLVGITPLFISLLVAAVTWSLLGAGQSGYLNVIFRSLGIPVQVNLQSLAGIAFVFGIYYTPYPFLFVYSALTLIHPDLEEAAAVHGGNVSRNLLNVTFPLVAPAVIGSLLLIITLMIEDFPVPQILAGSLGIEMLSIRIYNLMTRVPAELNEAASLSVVLTAGVAVLVYAQRRLLGARDYRTVTGKGMQPRVVALGRLRWAAVALVAVYGFVAVVLPLIALLQGALRSNLYLRDAAALFDVSQLGLKHLSAALTDRQVLHGLANSFVSSAATAVFGTTLFFVLAYVVNRTDLPRRQFLEYLAMIPLAIPALVLGIGMLWAWSSMPVPVYGTLAILVIAFVTRFIPQGYRSISASMAQIHDDLENAALVAGAGRLRLMRTITLPLVKGGVGTAAILMVILSFREVTSAVFLYTSDTRVLSIVLYESYENGVWARVASISLIYTAIMVTLTLLGRRWLRAGI